MNTERQFEDGFAAFIKRWAGTITVIISATAAFSVLAYRVSNAEQDITDASSERRQLAEDIVKIKEDISSIKATTADTNSRTVRIENILLR
jgi:peptidoglycan hydrolase CwlO-like protein